MTYNTAQVASLLRVNLKAVQAAAFRFGWSNAGYPRKPLRFTPEQLETFRRYFAPRRPVLPTRQSCCGWWPLDTQPWTCGECGAQLTGRTS